MPAIVLEPRDIRLLTIGPRLDSHPDSVDPAAGAALLNAELWEAAVAGR